MSPGVSEDELLMHIRKAYEGRAVLGARVQHTVLKEYSRLRRSERGCCFYRQRVSQLTPAEKPCALSARRDEGQGHCKRPLCRGRDSQDTD